MSETAKLGDFFQCPRSWVGREIIIQFAIPSVDPQGKLSFPGMKAVLLEDQGAGLHVKLTGGGILGELVIGKERIQDVRCISPIVGLAP